MSEINHNCQLLPHKGSKINLEIDGIKTSWESPDRDCTIEELIEAFFGLCIAQTYVPASIYDTCANWVENNRFQYATKVEND